MVILGPPGRPPAYDEVSDLARAQLGAPVARWLFTHARRATTYGALLADRRSVVIKVHPRNAVDEPALAAAQHVQRHLHERGFPCPGPLLGPVAAGDALVTAETLLDRGVPPNRRRRRDRRAMGETLARVVGLCRSLPHLEALDDTLRSELPRDVLWPAPHDPRLAFDRSDAETAWIDDLGGQARARRNAVAGRELVVGHGDWHIEHLRLERDEIVAVYDWASVVRAPEAFLVGSAVGGFTADWSVDEPASVPRASDMFEFVRAYERVRGAPFDSGDRGTIHAHWVEMTAYAARLELAKRDAGLRSSVTYAHRLREHGEALIAT